MAELKIFDDAEALARAAAGEIASNAETAIASQGRFTIALSGGSTPRPIYRLLAEQPYRDRILWDRVHVFWGDERHVPPDHPDSNYGMVREALLDRVPVPAGNIYRVRAEKPDAERAAHEYEWTLRSAFNLDEGQVPRFDLVLMGLGPDGHTASLFPGSDAVRERTRLVVAPWVSAQSSFRITMTLPVLNRAACALFVVSGEEKAEALRSVLEGDLQPDRFPAQAVRLDEGRLLYFVDRAAARLLRREE